MRGLKTPLFHPSDKDPSLHPNEQESLAGDPESPGTPSSLRNTSCFEFSGKRRC